MSLESQAYELAAKLTEFQELCRQIKPLADEFLKDLLGENEDGIPHSPNDWSDPKGVVHLHDFVSGDEMTANCGYEPGLFTSPRDIAQALVAFIPDAEAFKARKRQELAERAKEEAEAEEEAAE